METRVKRDGKKHAEQHEKQWERNCFLVILGKAEELARQTESVQESIVINAEKKITRNSVSTIVNS